MNDPTSKASEKLYLQRTGGSAWEALKPFSPPGSDQFREGLELLNDFVVALWLLQPSAEDRILDLGAGGGWCSDLLRRMNRQSFAVDIALDMLRIARKRSSFMPIPAIAGDLEQLPFRDGAFDKAVCISALHHVPDMAKAIREIHRVLNDRGVVVFSEPGVGHSGKPWSVAAVRDFGVLEQEVLIQPTIAMCRDAGFVHVHVCPISYVIPEFELTDQDWRAWMRLARTKRPVRAMHKIWKGVLELLGIGKADPLFEEAFAMRLVRLLQVPVMEHPFIVAAKSAEVRRHETTYRAEIRIDSCPTSLPPGGSAAARISVKNIGSATWRAQGRFRQTVLGLQLTDARGRVLEKDFARCPLSDDVAPGSACPLLLRFTAPEGLGEYVLKFDMVVEGVTWFEPVGSRPTTHHLSVR